MQEAAAWNQIVREVPSFWQWFFRGKITYGGKNCDSGSEVLHVATIQFLI